MEYRVYKNKEQQVVNKIFIRNKLLNQTSRIDKDIIFKDSPMKFNVPGKLRLARIKIKNNVESSGQ